MADEKAPVDLGGGHVAGEARVTVDESRIMVWDRATAAYIRQQEEAQRQTDEARREAQAANKHLIMAVRDAGLEEGRRQAEQALLQAQSVTQLTGAPPVAGTRKPAKDPKGPSEATQAAIRAIAHFTHLNGLSTTGDSSLLAKDIVQQAVKAGLPGSHLLTPRSMIILITASQDGVRLADFAETD
jgi:hypothetical protein